MTGWAMWLLVALPAGAAQDSPAVREQVAFSRIDSDHNGYVSRVEARLILAVEHFEAADGNRDGLLNREEYAALLRDRQPDTDSAR